MKNVFDIYRMVYGYTAVPFPETIANSLVVNVSEKLSRLGAALFKNDATGEAFIPVTLQNKTTGKEYSLPYSTIGLTAKKLIRKTPLVGRQGSVKELVQIQDYTFTIQGVILGDDLPDYEIDELRELFEINEPVLLNNAFAEIFMQADNSVVIEAMDLPAMKGISGAQAYTFRVISDTVLEIEEF